MADFCQKCGIETWGEDTRDLAGISTQQDTANGLYPVVLCEGCGPIQVDHEGRRIADDPARAAVARLRAFTAAYQEENPFAMHPLTAREWEDALERAADDAADTGATEHEIEEARVSRS